MSFRKFVLATSVRRFHKAPLREKGPLRRQSPPYSLLNQTHQQSSKQGKIDKHRVGKVSSYQIFQTIQPY
jgi:hypothetical protein